MKKFNLWIFCAFIVACSGGSGGGGDGSLTSKLSGKTFTLDTACGPSPGDSTDTDEPTTFLRAIRASHDDEEIKITFSGSNMKIKQGDVTMTATWKTIDENTIEVTSDGESVRLDVDIDGDTIRIRDEGASADCSSPVSGVGFKSTPMPAPSEPGSMVDPEPPAPDVSPSSDTGGMGGSAPMPGLPADEAPSTAPSDPLPSSPASY